MKITWFTSVLDSELLKTRVRQISEGTAEGKCVLYVMSRDQRVQDNHALLRAQKHAIAQNLPLAVVFCLQPKVGVRSREHYEFMLEGLKQVESDLKKLNIPLIMLTGSARELLGGLFSETRPSTVYFDFNPLRGPKKLLEHLSKSSDSPAIYVVDTHNVVPVWEVSDKQEVGAYTIRPKIHKKLATYLEEPERYAKHPIAWDGAVLTIDDQMDSISELIKAIPESGITIEFLPGENNAHKHLEQFIETKLESYAVDRNDPSLGSQSDLSPYLHFGQLSALRVALRLREVALKVGDDLHFLHSPKMPKPEDAELTIMHGVNALIEELIVRKELADNFCYYNDFYDSLDSAPGWARKSLDLHRGDPRENLYTLSELEQARTHDPAWNAAQKQLTRTGKMHGYMRMYWAKKVLEWSPMRPHNNGTLADFSENFDMDGIAHTATRTKFPEEIHNSTHSERSKLLDIYFSQFYGAGWAVEVLKYMNDHYSIDGGDPNGYAGIMWSVAGVHDRPWMEREIFGVVRYMNYAGLKRKFNIESYENQWQ